MNDATAPGRGPRLALAAIRALTPLVGEPRAQWVVGRGYALLYLARYYLAAEYGKASLGVFWVAIAPLLMIAVYLPVFLYVFKANQGENEVDYALRCLVGLMVWAAVQDAISRGTHALVASASIVKHAPTPPSMLPIVKVLSAFAGLAAGLLVFAPVLVVAGRAPGIRLVLLPLAYALLLLATLGLALLLSIAAAYVRDVLQALPTLLAVEFFAAPITYVPPETGLLGLALRLNPLTPFLGLFRAALLPWHPFAWADLGLAGLWTFVLVVVGATTFRRLESGLGDVI